MPVRLGEHVAGALRIGIPVVALESTLLAHGLPADRGVEVGERLESVVRAAGAVPATIGVIDGEIIAGLDGDQLRRLTTRGEDGTAVAKLSVRDLPVAAGLGIDGATTVASTAAIAQRAGIGVFATGGLGGVHRGASSTFDESADLAVLGATPITVVCSGVKSILDIPATLERLESLSVTVVGYRTDRFPGFYVADSGQPAPWRVDSERQVAAIAARLGEFGSGALVVANPISVDRQLDPDLHDRLLADALAAAATDSVTGKDITPYVLDKLHTDSDGATLEVNVELVVANAELAARIAVAAAEPVRPKPARRRTPGR